MTQESCTWTDSGGRKWVVSITVGTIKRVKDLIGVDLLGVLDGELLARLADDPVLLVDTLYAVCKPQADQQGVSDESFGELLVGDTIEQAASALVEGLTNFFPQRKRGVLAKLWAATTKAQQEASRMMESKLNAGTVDPLIRRAMQQASDEIDRQLSVFGGSSGSSPERSE